MSETTIRGGADAVAVETSEHGVRIALGPGGVDASVVLDPGEARTLAEAILADLEGRFGHDDGGDDQEPIQVVGVVFERVPSPEADLIVLTHPESWAFRHGAIRVKRFRAGGVLECGVVREDRGAVVWDGPDLVASYESFEAMVHDGWRVD